MPLPAASSKRRRPTSSGISLVERVEFVCWLSLSKPPVTSCGFDKLNQQAMALRLEGGGYVVERERVRNAQLADALGVGRRRFLRGLLGGIPLRPHE